MIPAEQQLRSLLDGLARAWWRVRWLHLLARVAAVVAALLLIWWAWERVQPFGRAGVLVVSSVFVAVLAAGAAWLAWQWRRRPNPERMALLVQERCPDLDAPLQAALDPKTMGSPLGVLVMEDAREAVARLDVDRVVDPDDRQRGWRMALAAAVVLLVSFSVAAPTLNRAARTWWFTVSPPQVTLRVEPGHQRVVRGSALRLVARVEGLPAGVPYDVPTLSVRGEDAVATGVFDTDGDGAFALDIPAVTRDFRYQVLAGGLVSDTYLVEALDRPSVARVDLEYVYPSFSGLAPRQETDSGDIYAPAGTRVTVTVQSTKPLQSATLVPTSGTGLGESVPLQLTSAEGGAATFEVKEDGAYRIALVDQDTLDNPGDTEYFVRIMDDRPPDVRILRPAGDRGATRLEEVVIEARADDDYGVQRLELVYAVRGGSEKVVPLGGDGSSTAVSGRHTLYLEDLDVKPGDFISYYARARDIGRGKRSTESRSDIFFLEVRPTAQEFLAAQSSGGMNMAGGEMDDLVAAQKDIVVATWKLERRTTAGSSADDIRAVGRAQEEVRDKALAQAAMGNMTPGPRRRGGAELEPEAAPAPMQAAAEAMTRATGELNGLRVAAAIPHEMEALNQLLLAQAEIRRRQIARQQQGGGGGGRQTGNEDLSALFDRELLRQQGSNYEQRSSVESRADAQEDSALDKIRELARRQDDLAREQQALARERNQLDAEEVKRRLERLTREQEQLRQEAQQLARQLQQENGQRGSQQQQEGQQPQDGQQAQGQQQGQEGQQGQQGQQGQGQASGGGGSASADRLAQAAEQMQEAASQLQNASPDEAAARGSQSAQALRDAERAMQGTLPDERRRAAGDVQLEARSLADAQRRLAEDASRLSTQGGQASEEQRRRIGGEQGRVAERIAQLERQLRELARGTGNQSDPLARAAAELARQRLGEQLREAGRALSDESGADAGDIARQQRDAAGVLDRVASLAGQATGRPDGDSRALSEQLADARDARDRLRALEQRIEELARQAEQMAQQGQAGQPGGQSGSKSGAKGQDSGSPKAGQAAGNRGGDGQAQGQGGGAGLDGIQRELERLQQQYREEMQTAQRLLQQGSDGGGQDRGGRMATPEGAQFSRSAPGTEAFKQDFARWESLKQGVASAMDRYEASLAQRLSEREAAERVNAPARDRVPDRYAESVIRYYQSLSRRPETR